MKHKTGIRKLITAALLIIALGACIFGALRGEVRTVNKKSTNICLECIGIG